MSYLDRGSAREKVNAAMGVGALHALLGAGLLVGLAVKVAPDRIPEPIVVELQKPEVKEKPQELPPPTTLEQIQVRVAEPVVEYPALPPETALTPVANDPFAEAPEAATVVEKPVIAKPALPVRMAAIAKGGTVGIRTEDYPDASRRAGEAGRITIRVEIGTDGGVKGCAVISSTGHERLDRKTCEVAQRRWRFSPATEDGVAVPSTQERSIVWRLEGAR